MTDLDMLARAATTELLERSHPDVTSRYAELRRIRTRRTTGKLVAVAATIALGVTGWQLAGGHHQQHRDNRPVGPVHLRVQDAEQTAADVVAQVRTTQKGDDVDYDRFDGVTDDGLVVRQRYTHSGDVSQFGLLDPATGQTDWLPLPTWDLGEPSPLRLSADRLVYLDNRHAPARFSLLTFDRASQTWQRQEFREPARMDRFFGFTAELGDDGRVYLLDPVVGRVRWFSIGPGETSMRAEPELDGLAVAFSDGAQLTADQQGRVLENRSGAAPQVLEQRLPDGCVLDSLPQVALAGDRAVVSLPCHVGPRVTVYDPAGDPSLSVDASMRILAVGPDHLLLTDDIDTFTLDLDGSRLVRIDAAPHEVDDFVMALAGDLAVWDVTGPSDDDKTSDDVYQAGVLP